MLLLVAFVVGAGVILTTFGGGEDDPTAGTGISEITPLPGSLVGQPLSSSTTLPATEVLAAGIAPVPDPIVPAGVGELPTTTEAPTPTTTTLQVTTTTVRRTTTTLPSTTTTTSRPTTTTTSTTTTVPPPTTTTTLPATTTTTVLPTTTTTIVDGPVMFVTDLDGEANCCDNDAWFARVRATVASSSGNPVEDAVVAGVFSGEGIGPAVARTDSNGVAIFEFGPIEAKEITFSVLRLAHRDYEYDSSQNRESSITFGPE